MAGDPIMHQVGVVAVDDDHSSEEDVCSICLDAFDSHHNPSTVTTCKHEFHLQCILEWSQRSKECPICWQLAVLKDPASQELLSIVEDERNMRFVANIRQDDEDSEVDSDFEEQVMTTFGSSMRNEGVGPSQVHPLVPGADVSIAHEMYTSLEEFHSLGYDNLERCNSIDYQTSPSFAGSSTSVHGSQTPSSSPGRPITADMHAFSESVKSKFSAASARYKESISKGTQGLKEKLLAKNSPVKELSRGVQREMSAGFAKMFQRLDPSSKRNNPLASNGDGLNFNIFKGKRTQD